MFHSGRSYALPQEIYFKVPTTGSLDVLRHLNDMRYFSSVPKSESVRTHYWLRWSQSGNVGRFAQLKIRMAFLLQNPWTLLMIVPVSSTPYIFETQ